MRRRVPCRQYYVPSIIWDKLPFKHPFCSSHVCLFFFLWTHMYLLSEHMGDPVLWDIAGYKVGGMFSALHLFTANPHLARISWCVCSQSFLTLCNPMGYRSPGSSIHGIISARILEWVAISSSRGSYWPRDRSQVSFFSRWILYHLATGEAQRTTLHQEKEDNLTKRRSFTEKSGKE